MKTIIYEWKFLPYCSQGWKLQLLTKCRPKIESKRKIKVKEQTENITKFFKE